jgi:hypothetical protein
MPKAKRDLNMQEIYCMMVRSLQINREWEYIGKMCGIRAKWAVYVRSGCWEGCQHLVLPILKPLGSKDSLYSSNLLFTPALVLPIKTMSSANNIHHGTSSYKCPVNSSIITTNKYGLKGNP